MWMASFPLAMVALSAPLAKHDRHRKSTIETRKHSINMADDGKLFRAEAVLLT